MGGDGGTLNNTRHELTRVRQSLLRSHSPSTKAAQDRERASTTHCALTQLPLSPPHVVVDRLGNLFNKDALLNHLLSRPSPDPLVHIRSFKRDAVTVNFVRALDIEKNDHVDTDDVDRSKFVCPVSRKLILPDARCSVGWNCGCVVAALDVLRKAINAQSDSCLACGVIGPRISLGRTRKERAEEQTRLLQEREARRAKRGKKRAADSVDERAQTKSKRRTDVVLKDDS